MNAPAHAKYARIAANFLALAISAMLFAPELFAQSQPAPPPDPTPALTAALSAACRQDPADFSNYLTDANAAAFRKLSPDDRISMMERFVLLDTKGRPLLSSGLQGGQFFLCEAGDADQKFTLGAPRVHDHLAYIPVTTSSDQTIQFGLVREDGNWKLLSIGLLLIDVPQLQKEWAAQQLKANEQAVIDLLAGLSQAVIRYQDAFGRLPDTLSQLGPPAHGGVSPAAANLIDSDIASGAKDGYEFRYRINTPAGSDTPAFEIAAVPQQYGKTGKRSFLLDEHGHIHGADHRGAVAAVDDPLVPDQPGTTQ